MGVFLGCCRVMNRLPIVVLGLGSVGRSLVRQIIQNRPLHASAYDLCLDIQAVSDSSGHIAPAGDVLSDAELAAILMAKEAGTALAAQDRGHAATSAEAIVEAQGGCCTIFADCSAADETADALVQAVAGDSCIVLANKKPLTQGQAIYDRLTRTPEGVRRMSCSRWEATVGAGLPIIATLQRLCSSGDQVESIAGSFSGTLGYVMTGLQAGQPFSEVVREAHARGYTEPDPRDDLSGLDVARKALILARGSGYRLELADVAVTGLYPDDLAALSVADFMDALPQLDAEMARTCAQAQAQDSCLRYVASVSEGALSVGPRMVPLDSPLGQLSGTDNLVQFTSQWYTPLPLVIQGRGAGVEATAAGVLSDIVELALAHCAKCC